jgi:hypothetical protein
MENEVSDFGQVKEREELSTLLGPKPTWSFSMGKAGVLIL